MVLSKEPGIYVEAKGVSGASKGENGALGYKHLYLIYHRPDGTTEVIRGGPSIGLFGKLEIETGKTQKDSSDKNDSNQPRPSKRLDVDAKNLDKEWASLRRRAEKIGERELEYDSIYPGDDVPEQNSNSVIRHLLEDGGHDIDKSLPDGIMKQDIPGYENTLTPDPSKSDGDVDRKDDDVIRGVENSGEKKENGSRNIMDILTPDTNVDTERDTSEPEPTKGSGLAVEGARNAVAEATPEPSEETRQHAFGMIVEDNESNPRGSIDTMLLKPVEDLTFEEMQNLGMESWRLQTNDPTRREIEDKRRAFYSKIFGDDPVEEDATGRMIDPQPKRTLPEKAVPLKTPAGETVTDSLKKFAGNLASALDEDGQTSVAKAVQLGVNKLGARLKVDGVSGPKTKAAVTRTLAKHGRAKAEEAFGLGRFQQFAQSERDAGGSATKLKTIIAKTVQPLLGQTPKNVAGEALQESINDLNVKAAAEKQQDVPEPLKVDGDIGSKTTDAFRLSLAENGPEKLAKSYGSMLGFG